ncbi:MAG: HD domain-containing protein [Caldilineaceae bacterium]
MVKARSKKAPPDWRLVCRQQAEMQALTEGRKAWKVRSSSDVPFAHRWEHIQSVVSTALWLARQTGADPEIVEASAWLHDIRKGTPGHGPAGAREAKRILLRTNFPAEKVPAVVDAIARHVGLYRASEAQALTPVETAVLWDADKLTKLGVQALAYNLSMSYMRGLTLPQRRSNMLEFTQSVLVRTVESMNTPPARQEAAQRYQVMLEMLEAWRREQELNEEQNEVSPDNTGLPKE